MVVRIDTGMGGRGSDPDHSMGSRDNPHPRPDVFRLD